MAATSPDLDRLLVQDLLERFPDEAAAQLERGPMDEAAALLEEASLRIASAVFRRLTPATAIELLSHVSLGEGRLLIQSLDPPQAGALLAGLDEERREEILGGLASPDAKVLRDLMEYPVDSAGRVMDPRIAIFRGETTVTEALGRLRAMKHAQRLFDLLIVDADGRLTGAVPLQEAMLAAPEAALSTVPREALVAVQALAPREEVVELMESQRRASLPVVDYDGKPIGVIRLDQLVSAVQKEFSADIVSMTGASAEERALSTPGFAVRKRLPWLQINLATAFLAAAVVGLFESTIAQFTALAVLLPVVAGQAGNTGAQALAVVLRGLALREITLRHWLRVARKELVAGVLNGLAVAVVTCAGVYVWSGSAGLVAVIGLAMVISMAIAGVAGAVIPVLLASLGQDPAQSSSIVLTTVTDVFGFFSFLGLATIFASVL